MSDSLSSEILERLRNEADASVRPKQRNATLDRLVEACNDITSGKALAIIKKGLPEAEVNFRRHPIKLIPIRIQEYVEARLAIDASAKVTKSTWTGPRDLTIRKDPSLYEYVQVRAQEQLAANPGKLVEKIDKTLDQVEDLALRSELRFILSRARQDSHDLRRLKAGMRKMRPTIDVDAIIKGINTVDTSPSASVNGAFPALPSQVDEQNSAHAVTAIMKFQNSKILSKCGLEYSLEFDNVVEFKTRFELITNEELVALRKLVGINE